MSNEWTDYGNTEEDGMTIMRLIKEKESLEQRLKEAEALLVDWNDHLKKTNFFAAKIGTTIDAYQEKWKVEK
jgi:hypothetical protein